VEEIREPPKKVPKPQARPFTPSQRLPEAYQRPVEVVEEVLDEIGTLVRDKREGMGVKQEDLAKIINEPVSLIKRVEHGFIPDLKIAHKLQRVLHVKLTEQANAEEADYADAGKKENLTLGDVIIIKKKD
ncbi:MAG: TIGR00270 family protein, partial [Candidatus Altiarchaeota archaeon]|nr:TIGR00270 family protein [Candidatus Altiarchaeota archaeon]